MHNQFKPLACSAIALFMLAASDAFAQKTPPPPPPPAVQPPKPPHIADFDDARRELDKAAAELEKNMKNFTVPEPPEPPAPPEMDTAEISRAMKELDAQKILVDVQRNLQQIDAEKIRKQADSALAKVDIAAIRKEMEASMEKMKIDLAAQKEAYAKVKEEMKTIKPKVEAEMKKAQAHMTKARAELDDYENFVNSLASDGRLNKAAYTIEHKNGKLYIDGKEQEEAVYNKHRSFLEKQKGLKITKNEDGLNIRKD